MKKLLEKWSRMLTPGHAVAAIAVVIVIYQGWGKIFEPGGTGSNVVLGLLVAIAAVYLGATNLGPTLDDLVLTGPKRALSKRRRAAQELADDVGQALKDDSKKKKKRLTAPIAEKLAAAVDELRRTIGGTDLEALDKAITATDKLVEEGFGSEKAAAAFVAQAKSLGIALGIAVALRLFLVAPFQIPSGSMIPTLLIGDHLFVFRAMYGLQSPFGQEPSYWARWKMPTPGDVVVFEAPPWVGRNSGEDWIKRVIASSGQHVKRIDQTVYVDGKALTFGGSGEPVRYMDFDEFAAGHGRWHESLGAYHTEDVQGVVHDTFVDIPPVTADWPGGDSPRADMKGLSCTAEDCVVKDGFVFVMGDNRDHSSDGRVWGAVPVDNIKGKALFIWVSVDGSEESVHVGKFTLPRFRWERLFRWIR